MDPRYSSHLPVLRAAIERTSGPILELGCGESSTPFLHAQAARLSRRLVSIETERDWWQKFQGLANETHWVRLIPDWKNWDAFCRQKWDVVLVDSAPDLTRAAVLPWLGHVRYVLVHDTEPEQAENYPGLTKALADYPAEAEYRPAGLPWTRVLSCTDGDLAWVKELA